MNERTAILALIRVVMYLFNRQLDVAFWKSKSPITKDITLLSEIEESERAGSNPGSSRL